MEDERPIVNQLNEKELQIAIMCIDISFPSDIKEALWNRFDVSMTKTEIHQVQLDIDEKLRYQLEGYNIGVDEMELDDHPTRLIECGLCGATYPWDGESDHATCPNCGEEGPVYDDEVF